MNLISDLFFSSLVLESKNQLTTDHRKAPLLSPALVSGSAQQTHAYNILRA